MKSQNSILFIGIVISIVLFCYVNKNTNKDNINKNIQTLVQVKYNIKSKNDINMTKKNFKKIDQKKEKYSFNKKEI